MEFYIGTSNACFTAVYGVKQGLQNIKECGFSCVDFALERDVLAKTEAELQDYCKDIKAFVDGIGLRVHQTHLPVFEREELLDKSVLPLMQAGLRASAILGAGYCIVEPIVLEDAENTRKENFALNLDMYRTLRETASACGVTIAIPNTVGYNELKKTGAPNICSSAGKLNELIDELGDGFCACLDTSRAYYAGQLPWKTAELLGARLKASRLADNDGKGAEKLMVTGGYVVWKNLTTALKTIGYQGVLTFDPDYLRSGESALLPLGKLACAIGTDFIQDIKK